MEMQTDMGDFLTIELKAYSHRERYDVLCYVFCAVVVLTTGRASVVVGVLYRPPVVTTLLNLKTK